MPAIRDLIFYAYIILFGVFVVGEIVCGVMNGELERRLFHDLGRCYFLSLQIFLIYRLVIHHGGRSVWQICKDAPRTQLRLSYIFAIFFSLAVYQAYVDAQTLFTNGVFWGLDVDKGAWPTYRQARSLNDTRLTIGKAIHLHALNAAVDPAMLNSVEADLKIIIAKIAGPYSIILQECVKEQMQVIHDLRNPSRQNAINAQLSNPLALVAPLITKGPFWYLGFLLTAISFCVAITIFALIIVTFCVNHQHPDSDCIEPVVRELMALITVSSLWIPLRAIANHLLLGVLAETVYPLIIAIGLSAIAVAMLVVVMSRHSPPIAFLSTELLAFLLALIIAVMSILPAGQVLGLAWIAMPVLLKVILLISFALLVAMLLW